MKSIYVDNFDKVVLKVRKDTIACFHSKPSATSRFVDFGQCQRRGVNLERFVKLSKVQNMYCNFGPVDAVDDLSLNPRYEYARIEIRFCVEVSHPGFSAETLPYRARQSTAVHCD